LKACKSLTSKREKNHPVRVKQAREMKKKKKKLTKLKREK